MISHDMNWHPDAERHLSSEEGFGAVNEPRLMDGVAYAPADAMKLGFEGATFEAPSGFGLLFMSVDRVGICSAMPPPQMRALAAALTKLADMTEAQAASIAAAAIDRAKAAGQ